MEAAESPRPLLHAAPHAAPIGVSLRSLSLHVQSRVVSSQSAARDGGGGGGGTSGGANCILHNLTGDIPAGGLFLVYGGSGSGKTSLLNALAGRLGAAGYRLTGACARAVSRGWGGPHKRTKRGAARAVAAHPYAAVARAIRGLRGCCALPGATARIADAALQLLPCVSPSRQSDLRLRLCPAPARLTGWSHAPSRRCCAV
jgi:hypothetical protein